MQEQEEEQSAVAEAQQPKGVSTFSSSSSSPWDSPDDPFQAHKPATERAQSAPITLPSEPVDPISGQTASSPPKSVDAFSSLCWSQSQWFAFSDNFAPSRHQASVKDVHRPQTGAGRSTRFLSDGSSNFDDKTEASKLDSAPCFSDDFSGIPDKAAGAATSSKLSSGKMKDTSAPDWDCLLSLWISFSSFCSYFCNHALFCNIFL